MSQYTEFIELIKQIATNAVEAAVPADVTFGRVTGADPLTVEIMQGVYIQGEQIVLSERLAQSNCSVTIGDESKLAVFDNALKEGDRLMLVKKRGGQSYWVIDRLPGEVEPSHDSWGEETRVDEDELQEMLEEVFG